MIMEVNMPGDIMTIAESVENLNLKGGKALGKYKGKWCVLIGFKGEHLKELDPIIKRLREKYPKQEYNVMSSKFPQYDFILTCFAKDREEAHHIGLALIHKELPPHLGLLYWVKELSLVEQEVKK